MTCSIFRSSESIAIIKVFKSNWSLEFPLICWQDSQYFPLGDLHCALPSFSCPRVLSIQSSPQLSEEPLGVTQVHDAHFFPWSLSDAVESWLLPQSQDVNGPLHGGTSQVQREGWGPWTSSPSITSLKGGEFSAFCWHSAKVTKTQPQSVSEFCIAPRKEKGSGWRKDGIKSKSGKKKNSEPAVV